MEAPTQSRGTVSPRPDGFEQYEARRPTVGTPADVAAVIAALAERRGA